MVFKLLCKNHVKEILYKANKEEIGFYKLKKEFKINKSYLKYILNELESKDLILRREKRVCLLFSKPVYSISKRGKVAIDLYELERELSKDHVRPEKPDFDVETTVYYNDCGIIESFMINGKMSDFRC